jgi:hypothetical protein
LNYIRHMHLKRSVTWVGGIWYISTARKIQSRHRHSVIGKPQNEEHPIIRNILFVILLKASINNTDLNFHVTQNAVTLQ